MKILFLGEIFHGQTSLMRMRALERLGHIVSGVNTMEPWKRTTWLNRQIGRRLQRGPVVKEINSSVLDAARQFRPDLVWGEKQEFLWANTIEAMRSLGSKVVHFTPDPYFFLKWKRTRLMDSAMSHFDALVFCKKYEERDYIAQGVPTVYMPLGYCDETHRPIANFSSDWSCSVGFLGGWEPRREELLAEVTQLGVGLKIWGAYWDFLRDGRWSLRRKLILRQLAGGDSFCIHRHDLLGKALQGGEVYGDDYARALTGAGIGLGFLRKVCPDQHTTRTFEIPACGSMLLADRTNEHQEFFQEGKEAEFFSSKEELLEKIRFYTLNDSARTRVAQSGREKCIAGKYSYFHRLERALSNITKAFN